MFESPIKSKVDSILKGEVSIGSLLDEGKKIIQSVNGEGSYVSPSSSMFAAIGKAKEDEDAQRRKTVDSVLSSGKKLANAATQAISEPGTLFAKPLLEKQGFSPQLAGLMALGIDLVAPMPGGKAKAGEKILKTFTKEGVESAFSALSGYKYALGSDVSKAGEKLMKEASSNPIMSEIAKDSQDYLKRKNVKYLYRYGDDAGMSWTTKPDKYFQREFGKPKKIEVTPEILNNVIFSEGAVKSMNRLGYMDFKTLPNLGESEVILKYGGGMLEKGIAKDAAKADALIAFDDVGLRGIKKFDLEKSLKKVRNVVKSIVKKDYSLEQPEIYLVGSRLKGKASDASDVDILFKFKTKDEADYFSDEYGQEIFESFPQIYRDSASGLIFDYSIGSKLNGSAVKLDDFLKSKSQLTTLRNEAQKGTKGSSPVKSILGAGAAVAGGAAIAPLFGGKNEFTIQGSGDVKKSDVQSGIPVDALANALKEAETGIIPDEKRYSFNKPSGIKLFGNDLGAYQVTSAELKTYAPRYLGRAVTDKEFLASPQLQDEYMRNKIAYLRGQGMTDEEILAIHRGGMNVDTTSTRSKKYVERAMSFINND